MVYIVVFFIKLNSNQAKILKYTPKVIVANFTTIVADVFQDHGITTKMYNAPVPNKCEYKLTYTVGEHQQMHTLLI
jgi:hypothetical protein